MWSWSLVVWAHESMNYRLSRMGGISDGLGKDICDERTTSGPYLIGHLYSREKAHAGTLSAMTAIPKETISHLHVPSQHFAANGAVISSSEPHVF